MKKLLAFACVITLTSCQPRPLTDGDMALRRMAQAQEVRDRAIVDCDTLHEWGETCPAENRTQQPEPQ